MEVLKTPLFWLLYVMFVLVAAGGLIVTAQFASIAADFGVAESPLSLLGITGTVLTVALVVDNVLNGLARPFFGWVSDKIGREADHVHRLHAGGGGDLVVWLCMAMIR